MDKYFNLVACGMALFTLGVMILNLWFQSNAMRLFNVVCCFLTSAAYVVKVSVDINYGEIHTFDLLLGPVWAMNGLLALSSYRYALQKAALRKAAEDFAASQKTLETSQETKDALDR